MIMKTFAGVPSGSVGGVTLDASFNAVRRFGHVVSSLGWGSHLLAPLSFRAATYSGVFALHPLLTGECRKHHGELLRELYRRKPRKAGRSTGPFVSLHPLVRIHPEPGEKLAFYDENIHGFRVNPGQFQILVGAASDDIRAKAGFEVALK